MEASPMKLEKLKFAEEWLDSNPTHPSLEKAIEKYQKLAKEMGSIMNYQKPEHERKDIHG